MEGSMEKTLERKVWEKLRKARLTVNMGTSVNILFKAFKDVPSDSSNRSSGL